MLTTLAFLAALPLSPADAGGLTLTNATLRYGLFGPVRPEGKVLPGDSLAVRFEIENVAVDKEGKAHYASSVEVTDPAGKVIFEQAPRPEEVYLTLGGTSLPASATVVIGLEQSPGEYTIKVTVKDTLADKSATLTQKFTVQPKGFGFIGLAGSSDPEGKYPSGPPYVGQALYLNAAVIGFDRGPKKQPNLVFEMTILDEQGKPTLPKAFDDVVDKNVPDNAAAVPVQFLITINRPGKFTAELKATDKVGNKTTTLKIPFTVPAAH